MKILKIDQRSEDWHVWRNAGIGASESSALMGMNPWRTPLQLWEDKTGRGFPIAVNKDMQRGIDNEDEARFLFNEIRGKQFFPVCAQHERYPIIKASFDGLTQDMTEIIEIKCPRSTKMSDAICTQDEAIVKAYFPYYWCQVQHQYAVCETATNGFLVAFMDGHINWINISRDEAFIVDLIEKCLEFWKCVETDTPPSMENRDQTVINDAEAVKLANEYKRVVAHRKALEAQENALKRQIEFIVGDHSAIIGDTVKVSRFDSSRIDYKRACEENNIQLAPYTKVNTGSYRFTVIGG